MSQLTQRNSLSGKTALSSLLLLYFYLLACGSVKSEDVHKESIPRDMSEVNASELDFNGARIDGKKEGRWTRKLRGAMETILHYKGDVPHGAFIKFYPSGNRKICGFYQNGDMVGRWYEYSEEGALKNVFRFKDAILLEGESLERMQGSDLLPPEVISQK